MGWPTSDGKMKNPVPLIALLVFGGVIGIWNKPVMDGDWHIRIECMTCHASAEKDGPDSVWTLIESKSLSSDGKSQHMCTECGTVNNWNHRKVQYKRNIIGWAVDQESKSIHEN